MLITLDEVNRARRQLSQDEADIRRVDHDGIANLQITDAKVAVWDGEHRRCRLTLPYSGFDRCSDASVDDGRPGTATFATRMREECLALDVYIEVPASLHSLV